MSPTKKNGHAEPTKKLEVPKPVPTPIKGAPAAFATMITPDMAVQWLEKNTMNRPLSQSSIDTWASVMKRGQWLLNGETIIISDNGDVLDGQHRLNACFLSGTNFESYVIIGMTKAVFSTIDSGKKRSGADTLHIHNKMHGIEGVNEARVMAAISTVLEYQTGQWKARHTHTITNADKIKFLEKYPAIAKWVADSMVKGFKRWENKHAATIGAVAFMGSARYEMKARTFATGFTSGEGLTKGSPILELRTRLSSQTQMQKWTRVKLIAYAWNLHVEDSKRDMLRVPIEMPVIAGTEPPTRLRKIPVKRISVSTKGKQRVTHKNKEAAEIAYIKGGR